MKEATGELNMTVITVVAIAAVAAFFTAFMWPTIRANINRNTWCSQAISCDCDGSGTCNCQYCADDNCEEVEEVECPDRSGDGGGAAADPDLEPAT